MFKKCDIIYCNIVKWVDIIISKVKKSNFELLRIVSMAMVVGLHYLNPAMGGAIGEQSHTDFNFYVTYFLESLSIAGVNCFVLIMGYFQVHKTSVSFNKVLNLLLQVFFYSFVLYFVGVFIGGVPFSLTALVKASVPFLMGLKWFVETYVILYLLSPFINRGLTILSKKEFQIFLGIMLLFFSLWPSILPNPPVEDRGYGIINFVLMYAIGAYLRKFGKAEKSKAFYFSGYLLSSMVVFVGSVAVQILVGGGVWIIWGYNFIFNIMGSVFLFLFFSKLEVQSKTINCIASYAFGVYLIHTDPSINDLLYNKILKTSDYWFSPMFIIHAILSVALVYAGCTIIDMGRKWLFDKVSRIVIPFTQSKTPALWKQIP